MKKSLWWQNVDCIHPKFTHMYQALEIYGMKSAYLTIHIYMHKCKILTFSGGYVSFLLLTKNPRVLSRERFNHIQYIWIYCATFIVPIKYLGVFSMLGVLMRSFLTHWNLKEWYLNSLVQEITGLRNMNNFYANLFPYIFKWGPEKTKIKFLLFLELFTMVDFTEWVISLFQMVILSNGTFC